MPAAAATSAAQQRFLLTLERMALGGIHDHLGGGFARYSVDERWLVPHFEKMLYDNAQLLELYALGLRRDRPPPFPAMRPRGSSPGSQREMTTARGRLRRRASMRIRKARKAGSMSGAWPRSARCLGEEDAAFFAQVYDITEEGNFEGHNIPNRLISGEAPPAIEERLAAMRAKLLERRAARVRPGLDDKVLADWNGLMIGALVRAAPLLGRPEWIALAQRAYRFVRRVHEPRRPARPFLARRLADLSGLRPRPRRHDARGARALRGNRRKPSYLQDARTWRDVLLSEFLVEDTGCLAMTAEGADPLVVRPQPTQDDAVPNANGVFAEALVRLAQITEAEDDIVQAPGDVEPARRHRPLVARSATPRSSTPSTCTCGA